MTYSKCLKVPARSALLLGLAVFTAPLWAATETPNNQDIVVNVEKNGAEITVDIDCPVTAPLPVVWQVLTDYDHMAGFISNLDISRVQARDKTKLEVYQKGKAKRGPLSFAFENVRAIELRPEREIHSRLISGDMKASEFTTRIVDDGSKVIHITNSGRYTPNMWVPPIIGPALIAAEMRKQFGEIRAEILRRSGAQMQSTSP
ncbi:MAG: SRPBCC family protein [Gammaproteobacteria bacterium]